MEESTNIRLISFKNLLTLNNSPFLVLTLLSFLIPTFFIPSTLITFQFGKAILISMGILTALFLHVILILKKGEFSYFRSWFFWGLIALPVVYLISALTSDSSIVSLFGYGFEINTFGWMLLSGILLFLGAVEFVSSRKLAILQLVFFASAAILGLFHLGRIFFGADFLSFGFFQFVISNTIGKWNEVGVFFGASALASLIALELLRFRMATKIFFYVLLIISLVMIVFIGFPQMWYTVGLFALIFFVYLISFEGSSRTMAVVGSDNHGNDGAVLKSKGKRISVKSLAVIIVALAFITPIGSDFSQRMAEKYGISNTEVRPSWIATYEVAKPVLKSDPIFGSGPNTFSKDWQLYKPDINLSNFWNADFTSGIGVVPTAFVETGIIGGLAWLVFLALFLLAGCKALFNKIDDRLARYFTVSTFFVSLYLWYMNFTYVTNLPLFALTFFMTGIFMASAANAGVFQVRSISFFKFPKVSFAFVMVFVFILIATVTLGYFSVEKVIASSYFQKGNFIINNDITALDEAEASVGSALKFTGNDLYYRALADINIMRLNSIIASVSNQSSVSDATKSQFESILSVALEAAKRAELYDPKNFENHVYVARVYQTIMPTGLTEAYDKSKASYETAMSLSPKNPGIYLTLARLEAARNDLDKAKENIMKAIELKSNYAEAIFFLSQVDVAQGNIASAINSVEKLIPISPDDPNIYFRLGLLKYDAKDFAGAVEALEKSISLVPVYANAKYFLGLSYEKIGKTDLAIAQFEDLTITNPENKEIFLVLSNLKAGKDPFADAKTPIDNRPEKRDKLPVVEKEN